MAITVAQLGVNVKADTSGAEAGLRRVGGLFGNVGTIAAAGVLAVAGIGAASLKMAGDFQANTLTLVTGAGESEKSLGQLRTGILKLATDTGTSTKQLTDGMFMISSAASNLGKQGDTVAKRLEILKDSAEAAKVGAADLGTVADGVTTIMSDFSDKGVTAAQAANLLIAEVANGKSHMQDMSQSMASILPTASALHIGLYDVAGAMSTMTGEGVPAANAATYLRQVLLNLSAPAKAGQKALADIGLTAGQVSDDMKKSLPNTLQLIMDHLAKTYKVGSPQYVAALKSIAGGQKNLQGLLDLTGNHLGAFNTNVKNITDTVKKGGSTINGWSLVQQTFNFQVSRAREVLETLGIKLGTLLLPVATKVASFVADNLVPILGNLANTLGLTGDGSAKAGSMLQNLAAFMTKDVIPAVTKLWTNFQTQMLPQLEKLATFVKTNVLPVLEKLALWFLQKVLPAAQQVSNWVMTRVVPILEKLWTIAATEVIPVLQGIADNVMKNLVPALENLWNKLSPVLIPVFHTVADVLKNEIGPALNVVIGFVSGLVNIIATVIGKIGDFIGLLGSLKDKISNIPVLGGIINSLPHFADGGTMPATGLAVVGEREPEVVKLPGGAQVTPMSRMGSSVVSLSPAGMSSANGVASANLNGQPIQLDVYLDGYKVAQVVTKHQPSVVRNGTGNRGF